MSSMGMVRVSCSSGMSEMKEIQGITESGAWMMRFMECPSLEVTPIAGSGAVPASPS